MTGHEEALPEWARAADEAYRQAVKDLYYEAYRAAPSVTLFDAARFDAARTAWVLPAGATEWEPFGYINPITGTVYEDTGPAEVPVVTMPCEHGDTAGFTTTVEASLTGDLRALFDALTAAHQADLDRRLLRLADDLGLWEPVVRRQFQGVQYVLEEAGAADGYGRLTISQPVRPPIEPPVRKRLS
ncbi:hypothetical protein [Streptomyces sp. NPDC048392]|uniref:hypothetical protein n=1 Tax=Streptomyces sp. NPDC048392 TaxID=3365543 RepID=UPI00372466D8